MLEKEAKLMSAKTVSSLFNGVPTVDQLVKICERGMIESFVAAGGRGRPRLFDFNNLVEIGIWKELNALQIPQPVISIAIGRFKEEREAKQGQGPSPKFFAVLARTFANDYLEWDAVEAYMLNAEGVLTLCETGGIDYQTGEWASFWIVRLDAIYSRIRFFFLHRPEYLKE